MADNALDVQARESTGKGAARKLRAAGRIPAVVYGTGVAPQTVTADPKVVDRLLQKSEAGMNTLIDLQIDGGEKQVVLVKELQRDPVRGTLVHADFLRLDLTKTVEVDIPIHLMGTPRGVSLSGGILDHTLREILVECLPMAIPDAIEVDVTLLEIGDSIHVRDLPLPEGVELLSDPELSVAAVAAPSVEEEPTAAEEAAAVPVEGEPAEEGGEEESPERREE